MTVPFEFQNAQRHFQNFLNDVREAADHASSHQAFTTVDAVFRVFARRLDESQRLAFAKVLPPLLGALFLHEAPGAPKPFLSRGEMTREVLAVRPHHNFAPPEAIAIVARELRRAVRAEDLEKVLGRLPPDAHDYWRSS